MTSESHEPATQPSSPGRSDAVQQDPEITVTPTHLAHEHLCVGPSIRPNDYEIIARAARGGEGFVWHARYRGTLPRSVDFAIKQFVAPIGSPPSEWPSPELIDRWHEQLKLLYLVHHDHLVGYKELFSGWPPHPAQSADGSLAGAPPSPLVTWYLVMEWIEGPTLHELVAGERLSLTERVEVIAQTAEAVDQLHAGSSTHGMALLHRDIKPGNIIVHPDRGAVLVDLGMLRVEEPAMTEVPMWTGPYLAPEVHANKTRCSRASDSWSLAATAFFALTGEHPSPMDCNLMREQLHQRLRRRVDDPARAIDVIMGVLERPPELRPPTTVAWASQLRDALATAPTGSHAAPHPDPNDATPSDAGLEPPNENAVRHRHRATVGILITTGLAVAAIVIVAVMLLNSGSGSTSTHQHRSATPSNGRTVALQVSGTGTQEGVNFHGTQTGPPLGTAQFSGTYGLAQQPPPCSTGPGTPFTFSSQVIASNGDVLRLTTSATSCVTGINALGYNSFVSTGVWTITGGTGKFRNATGTGSIRAQSDFQSDTVASLTFTDTGTLHYSK
jgi:serine/threonine protein kinase